MDLKGKYKVLQTKYNKHSGVYEVIGGAAAGGVKSIIDANTLAQRINDSTEIVISNTESHPGPYPGPDDGELYITVGNKGVPPETVIGASMISNSLALVNIASGKWWQKALSFGGLIGFGLADHLLKPGQAESSVISPDLTTYNLTILRPDYMNYLILNIFSAIYQGVLSAMILVPYLKSKADDINFVKDIVKGVVKEGVIKPLQDKGVLDKPGAPGGLPGAPPGTGLPAGPP